MKGNYSQVQTDWGKIFINDMSEKEYNLNQSRIIYHHGPASICFKFNGYDERIIKKLNTIEWNFFKRDFLKLILEAKTKYEVEVQLIIFEYLSSKDYDLL